MEHENPCRRDWRRDDCGLPLTGVNEADAPAGRLLLETLDLRDEMVPKADKIYDDYLMETQGENDGKKIRGA